MLCKPLLQLPREIEYLDENSTDVNIALAEVKVSRSINEETGIKNSEQNDEGDVGLETADKDDKNGQAPGKKPNGKVRVETLARETLDNIAGRRIRCRDSRGDIVDRCDRKPEYTHGTTIEISSVWGYEMGGKH